MPPEAASLLEAAGIDAGYGTMQVLWGVDLDVRAGETVLLLGANGAGKTTFLKSLVGLIDARHGSIRLGGERLGDAEHLALATGEAGCRRAALVAQHRKHAIHFLDPGGRIGMPQRLGADTDVFINRQVGKYRKLRHVGHAEPHPVAGAHPRHVLSPEPDAAMARVDQSDQRFEKGRLAGAIGAKQQHGLA